MAHTVVILADSTKFDRRGIARIGSLEQVDYIVTDKGAPAGIVSKIEKNGVRVIIADAN